MIHIVTVILLIIISHLTRLLETSHPESCVTGGVVEMSTLDLGSNFGIFLLRTSQVLRLYLNPHEIDSFVYCVAVGLFFEESLPLAGSCIEDTLIMSGGIIHIANDSRRQNEPVTTSISGRIPNVFDWLTRDQRQKEIGEKREKIQFLVGGDGGGSIFVSRVTFGKSTSQITCKRYFRLRNNSQYLRRKKRRKNRENE